MKKGLVWVICIALAIVFSTSVFGLVQVGEEVNEKFETGHPYVGKGLVVEEVYHSYNAGYIALHFSKFDLAPGDYVEISSPDGSFVYTYKEKGKSVRGNKAVISEFWATHIPGDTAVVKLYSKSNKGAYGFVIDKWVRGYEKELLDSVLTDVDASENFDANIEAICSSDDKDWAKCHEGTAMYDKSKAVCRLLINGSGACTGWLVGSEGHIMTNNHCIASQSDADNTDYEFMAEGGTCNTSCTGWFACPGTVEATSGTLVKTSSNLDYALVLLPTNLTGLYGYMQMQDGLPTIGERIYIPQHPGAKGKQIAVTSDVDGGYCKVSSTNEAPCMAGPGDIGYYADTEGGSSGSPVLAYDDNAVIALHHCANCLNRGVPTNAIIADLGNNIPNDAVVGGGTPPGPTPPTAPSSLSAKTKRLVVTLTWNDNANNEDGYKVYRGTSSSNLSLYATVGANTTTYRDSSVTKRTTYYYKVCGYNAEGETCSNVASVKAR